MRNADGNLLLQVHHSKDIMFRVGGAEVVSMTAMANQIAQTEQLVLGREVIETDSNRSNVGELGGIMASNYAKDSATISAKLEALTEATITLGNTMTSSVKAAEESLYKQIAKSTMLQPAGSILQVATLGGCSRDNEDALKTFKCDGAPKQAEFYGLNLIPAIENLYTCGIYKGKNRVVEVPATVALTQNLKNIKIPSAVKVLVTCSFSGADVSSVAESDKLHIEVREQGNAVPFTDESLGIPAMIMPPQLVIQ
jgi:hypothetical protein